MKIRKFPNGVSWIPLVLMGLGLAMVWAGHVLGEGDRVLAQARQICLSCMGLGG